MFSHAGNSIFSTAICQYNSPEKVSALLLRRIWTGLTSNEFLPKLSFLIEITSREKHVALHDPQVVPSIRTDIHLCRLRFFLCLKHFDAGEEGRILHVH